MDPKYAAVKGRRGPDIKCCTYVHGPIRTAHEARKREEPNDQRMANFRGRSDSAGNKKKQIKKQAMAPILQPANIRIRSHRLSTNQPSSSSRRLGAGRTAPRLSCVGSLTWSSSAKGLRAERRARSGRDVDASRAGAEFALDQPKEFMESRKDADAMSAVVQLCSYAVDEWLGLFCYPLTCVARVPAGCTTHGSGPQRKVGGPIGFCCSTAKVEQPAKLGG